MDAKSQQGSKEARVAMLIPAGADSRVRMMIRYRQEHHIIIRRSVL